jgi:hypothetical protein
MNDIDFLSNLLSNFGMIPKRLAIAILNKPNPEVAEHLIRRIRSLNRVWVTDEYIAANRFCKPDDRVITALWIAADYMKKAEMIGLCSGILPSVLTFIQNGEVYEVIVIGEGEDYMLASVDVDQHTKYIIVIPDAGKRNSIRYLNRFDCARYVFATVRHVSGNENPEICYYRRDTDETA